MSIDKTGIYKTLEGFGISFNNETENKKTVFFKIPFQKNTNRDPLSPGLRVLRGLMYRAFNNSDGVTLDDITEVLLEVSGNHVIPIAKMIVNSFSAVEVRLIVEKLLLRNNDDATPLRNSSDLLNTLLKVQVEGESFASSIVNDIAKSIAMYLKKNKSSTVKDAVLLLQGEMHQMYLQNFLTTLPSKLKKIPQFIKENCKVLYRVLLQKKFTEEKLIPVINGYLFLKYINPTMLTYTTSSEFAEHIKNKELTQGLGFDVTEFAEICKSIVTYSIITPVQKMANKLIHLRNLKQYVESPEYKEHLKELGYDFKAMREKVMFCYYENRSADLSAKDITQKAGSFKIDENSETRSTRIVFEKIDAKELIEIILSICKENPVVERFEMKKNWNEDNETDSSIFAVIEKYFKKSLLSSDTSTESSESLTGSSEVSSEEFPLSDSPNNRSSNESGSEEFNENSTYNNFEIIFKNRKPQSSDVDSGPYHTISSIIPGRHRQY